MTKMRIRKIFAAVAIGASAMTAVAAPAMADRQYVGGGTWEYGNNGLDVWSNYYHPNNNHRSSVSVNGTVGRSACTSPGNWSHASMRSSAFGENRAYWSSAC